MCLIFFLFFCCDPFFTAKDAEAKKSSSIAKFLNQIFSELKIENAEAVCIVLWI